MDIGRRERERIQRREHLLGAAERVFGRKLFDQATMQEVAAEAEIGMQGLYEHFPSKQDLYEQLMLHRAEAFRQRADAALNGAKDPVQQLRALAGVYAEVFKERPMFLPMFLRERIVFDWGFVSRFGPKIREIYAGERARLRAIVEKAVKVRLLEAMPVEFLTQLFMETLQASLYYHHRSESGEEVETCVNRTLDSFLQGVGWRP